MRRATVLSAMSVAAAIVMLAACAGGPPPPDWRINAKDAVERAVAAYLEGDARVEAAEFARARSQLARSGRADLLARAALARCAARVASLVFEACEDFEKLRPDAAAPERAYADYLAARVPPPDIALLPAQHRAVAAAANDDASSAAIASIADPLARLVAAGVLFQAARASPATLSLAVDTASSQGWRRPLLAWLNVQLLRAEKTGDAAEAQRLRRRIGLVQGQ